MSLVKMLFQISRFSPQAAAPIPLESVPHKVLKVNASQEPLPLASCADHRN